MRRLRNVGRLFRLLLYNKFSSTNATEFAIKASWLQANLRYRLISVASDRPVYRCGIEWSLQTEKVCSMPRRAASIAQGEICRVIRSAREAGAAEAIIDGQGQIRVVLSPNVPAASTSPCDDDDEGPVWTMSAPTKKERWSSRDATSWRDIQKHLLRP